MAFSDELFARHLPRALLGFVRLSARYGWVAQTMRVVAKRRAQAEALAIRRATVKRDADIDKRLAFAGRAE